MKKTLTTRDLVNCTVFAVIYFVAMYASGMLGFIGPIFMFVGWAVGIVLDAIIVMLLLARVPKIGAMTVTGLVVGLGMAPGHTLWVLPGAIILGIIADLVHTRGGKAEGFHPTRAIAAFVIFSLWLLVPLIPIVVQADAYFASIETMMGSDYTNQMRALFSPTALAIWAVISVCISTAAGYLGVRVARKHFSRAGLTR